MISVTISSAIRSSSGPSPNTVLISPSTKSRNTAGASAFHGSRVESLRQAARISLRARSGLSTAMSATLSRGTSSPTAIRKDSSPVATRSSSCCSRASSATRTHSRRDISSPPYDASLAKAARDGSRDPCVCAACPATPRLPWAPSRCGREEPAPPHLQDEKPRAAARREHPQCLCTKGSKLLPGSAPCPRRAAPPLRDPPSASSATWAPSNALDTSMDVKGA